VDPGDQGPETWVSLLNIPDGKVMREFKGPDAVGATGVHVDDDNTPGAGRTFQMRGILRVASPP